MSENFIFIKYGKRLPINCGQLRVWMFVHSLEASDH